MSRQITNFIAKMGIRSSRDILAEADRLKQATGMSLDDIERMRQKDAEINRMLRTGLSFLTTVQIARYAMVDLQQLASGKGGLTDILSLSMSAILLTFQLKAMLQESMIYLAIVNAITATTVGGLSGIMPVAGILAVVAGSQLYNNWASSRAAAVEEDQRMRMQAYRSVIGN